MVCCQCQQCQVSICCGCQMIVSDCSTDTGQRGHQSPQEGAGGRQEGGRRSPCWEFVQGICVPSPDASSSSLPEPLCTQVAAMPQSSQFCNPDPRVGGSLHCWGHTPGRALLLPGDSPRCGVQLPCCRAPWGAGTLLTRDNPGQEEPEQLFVLSCLQIERQSTAS